jgi:hypothetical protein
MRSRIQSMPFVLIALNMPHMRHAMDKTGPHATHGRHTEWCKRNMRWWTWWKEDMHVFDLDLWKPHTGVLDTLFREQIEVGLISRHLAYLTFHISNEPASSVSL